MTLEELLFPKMIGLKLSGRLFLLALSLRLSEGKPSRILASAEVSACLRSQGLKMNKNIGKLSSKVKEGEIVRKANVYRFVMFTIVFMFIFSTLAFTQGEDAFKIQGLIMNVDFQKKAMIVNESTFIWD